MAMATMLASTYKRPCVVAYVTNWDDLAAYAETIDYAKITHINVAFENLVDDEGNLSFNPADEALVKKARANGVKVLVSIGGGSAAEDKILQRRYFAQIAAPRRPAFVAKLDAYLSAHNLDGLDIDLEGPSINADYGPFVVDLAKRLRPKGKLLTAALSKGYGGDNVPSNVLNAFDLVNVMAYDDTGPWSPARPGQHSSMQLAQDSVAYWLGRGLTKDRLVLGVPFYGYGFGKDALGDEWSFAKILAKYPGAEKVDQVGETIWYNGIPTIQAKARYALDQRLAGVMIWSLASDASGEKSLLKALDEVLRSAK